jgi:hypothetical protein
MRLCVAWCASTEPRPPEEMHAAPAHARPPEEMHAAPAGARASDRPAGSAHRASHDGQIRRTKALRETRAATHRLNHNSLCRGSQPREPRRQAVFYSENIGVPDQPASENARTQYAKAPKRPNMWTACGLMGRSKAKPHHAGWSLGLKQPRSQALVMGMKRATTAAARARTPAATSTRLDQLRLARRKAATLKALAAQSADAIPRGSRHRLHAELHKHETLEVETHTWALPV